MSDGCQNQDPGQSPFKAFRDPRDKPKPKRKLRPPPLPRSQERATDTEAIGKIRRRLAALVAQVRQEFRNGATMERIGHKHSLPLALVEEILRSPNPKLKNSKPEPVKALF